jgi:RNA polymerase sigma factor (sigma-70 family)
MMKPGLRSVIRRLVSARARSGPDRHLLERFLAHKDETAFAALVERHGAMVLGVAWNVLRQLQDAEDVFQATFLVLARQAGSVRKQGSVGSWLHGVAYRLALKARKAAATRRRYESCSPGRAPGESPDDLTWHELSAILHEELERLPDKYRGPLVLCYLEGMTQDQASEHLGLARGTLKGRLERARLLLRSRLRQRGLAPAVILLADAYRPAGAALPAPLVSTTARAAAAFAAGGPAGVSAQVAQLTEGALKAMFVSKLRFAAALLVALGLVAGVGVLASRGASGGPPATAGPTARDEGPPEKPGEDRDKEAPWGETVDGWRMRLTTPSGTEYRRNAPFPLLLEVQNASRGPLALESLGWWNPDPEVTADGQRVIARPLIAVSPWEGRRDELPAGASIKWTVDFDRLRFSRQPLKAGAAIQVRFRMSMPGKVPKGAPRPAEPTRLFSNEVSLKLNDDHPSVMAGEADLPPKWTDSMELVYREHAPLMGYSALRIDGVGRVWLVTVERGKGQTGAAGLVRTEAVLSRDRLDQLARFLQDQKVWELADLSPADIAFPDEGEIRLSLGAGRGSLVGSFANHVVRDQPKLLRLKAEMEDVKAAAIKAAAKEARP